MGTLRSVLAEPMSTSLCRARVIATLMRRQSASRCPAAPSALLRTKLIRMQSLSRPCCSVRKRLRLACRVSAEVFRKPALGRARILWQTDNKFKFQPTRPLSFTQCRAHASHIGHVAVPDTCPR